MKVTLKFILRFILGIILLLLLILLAVSLFLFVPKVQEYVSHKASSYVSNKIGTEVTLGGLYLQFPNGISIEKLYVEDEAADTLLYTGNLEVSIDYFALLHAEVEVSNTLLENTTANIRVKSDSTFNFDYIIEAFAGASTSTTVTEDTTSSSSLSFDLGLIQLSNVRFSYRSEPDGMNTSYSIGSLSVDVSEFDLDNQVYTANSINLKNTNGNFEIFKSVPSSTDTSSLK